MEYAQKIKILTENLQKSEKVNSLDTFSQRESDTISHAILDMEESLKEISNELLPKLMNIDISEEDVDDILLDIGEELRHILYHIKDPKYFRYLETGG